MGGICPRCGLPYSWVERRRVPKTGRYYVYAVHYEGYTKVEGRIKKKKRYCYLGPAGSYEYVSRLHGKEGLNLKGLLDSDRALEYLDALIGYLENAELERREALRLAAKLRRLLKKLEAYGEGEVEGGANRVHQEA